MCSPPDGRLGQAEALSVSFRQSLRVSEYGSVTPEHLLSAGLDSNTRLILASPRGPAMWAMQCSLSRNDSDKRLQEHAPSLAPEGIFQALLAGPSESLV